MRVDGKIYATQINVQTNVWSDNVFQQNYKLRTIQDVENYIKIYKHLPDVPSEDNIRTNGIDLSKMDAVLLKKIEETMLYVIELKKENDLLKEQINNLSNRIHSK